MADSELTHLHQLHRTSQEKACYFLLAAAGSAVAFAVQKSGDAVVSWQLGVLVLAILTWGGSFYCGIKHLDKVQSAMHSNYQLLQLARGVHPKQPSHPQELQIASEVAREWVGRHADAAADFAACQWRLLIAGSLLFLTWHGLMILDRTGAL